MSFKVTISRQQGFTLLEIVLVLFLLALIASSTLFLTQGVEDQAKYDVTKQRLKMIRTAIIGDSSRTINGRPEISGFAADMGRLPECLRELLDPVDCYENDLEFWEQDPDSQVWAGWRGPYLMGDSEMSGQVHFRDSYGNTDTDTGLGSEDWRNSGWDLDLTTTVGAITITSIGFDVTDTVDDVIIENIISAADYQVTLGTDWQNIDIAFTNEQSTHLIIGQDELRLRLNTPSDGVVLGYTDNEFDTAAERNASTQLSSTFPSENRLLLSTSGTMEVDDTERFTFVPPATISLGSSFIPTQPYDSITLTPYTVITYTDSASVSSKFVVGSNCAPNCTLTFPDTTTYDAKNGTTTVTTGYADNITFNSTSTVTLQNHYIDPIITAENLAKPSIEVPVGTSLSSNTVTLPLLATITLPLGSAVLTDTTIVFAGSEITVSEPFAFTGTLVVTNNSGDTFAVPNGTTLGSTANSLIIPTTTIVTGGAKSFSVLCESTGSPYNGDCSTTGNHQPISMTLIPRKTLPVNTSPLEWTIQ